MLASPWDWRAPTLKRVRLREVRTGAVFSSRAAPAAVTVPPQVPIKRKASLRRPSHSLHRCSLAGWRAGASRQEYTHPRVTCQTCPHI